LHLDQN